MRNILTFLAAKSIKPFRISSQRATGNDCLIIVTPVPSSSSTWAAIAGGRRVDPPAFIKFRSRFDIYCSFHQAGSDWQASGLVALHDRADSLHAPDQRVASHLRARGPGHTVTIAEHRPRSNQAHLEW